MLIIPQLSDSGTAENPISCRNWGFRAKRLEKPAPFRILKAETVNDGRKGAERYVPHCRADKERNAGDFYREQLSRFCAERGLFPRVDCYRGQEVFFEVARKNAPTNAVISLPGVDGLNAVEHLRALFPETRIIWCSELDFSLHAFRLRVDYFLLEPITEEAFRNGLYVWVEEKQPSASPRADHNQHSKEDHR